MDTESSARPTAAGIYDYLLGGTANTAADRAAAEQMKAVLPEIADAAWANRGFHQRAVRRMATEWGIRQFIDIGAGLPTQRNTHEVLADVVPGCRVVYVDIDPLVVQRGRGTLAGVEGVAVIQGDLCAADDILGHEQTRQLIDLGQPVGLLMTAVIHFVSDEADPWGAIARYRDAVASGSYLALSTATTDHNDRPSVRTLSGFYSSNVHSVQARSKADIARFFDGWEIVPPYDGAPADLCYVGQWGAEDPTEADSEGSRLGYAAVARKP